MTVLYFCCDERRRALVRLHGRLNGIDFLEVVDHEEPIRPERQRLLRVFFVKPPNAALHGVLQGLTPANVRLAGGERVKGIAADRVEFKGDVLEVHVTPRGDFSPYTLSLVNAAGAPLDGLDPLLASVEFSFKVECAGDFDCQPQRVCPPEPRGESEIDYLAKDYASFRQLMLDRLSVLLPQWRERNPADLGIVLVELLAYVGDHLSYQQDAIATEAYLGTARRRASVRRHARLVDYFLHDGSNARAWVHVRLKSGSLLLPEGCQLVTQDPATGLVPPLLGDPPTLDKALAAGAEVFESLHGAALDAAHNRLAFYTWGDRECCLPKGATRATLDGRFPNLRPGDVLIFEEVLGPLTGRPEDANPAHRHAVRLTDVTLSRDPVGTPTKSDPNPPLTDVTEIAWAAADALPFALCLSAVTDPQHGSEYRGAVSVALGNVVLADHGRTVTQDLDPVPPDVFRPGPAPAEDRCAGHVLTAVRPRYRPHLQGQPLTQAATVPRTAAVSGRRRRLAFDAQAPAAAAFQWDLDQVLPAVRLTDEAHGDWLPRRDLLSSDASAPEFVAEAEDDGRAALRFGDDQNGLRPPAGAALTATYRIGNGVRGNVGAGAIRFIAGRDRNGNSIPGLDRVEAVRNPLAARGGLEPESVEHARQSAPSAFRVQQRAVTPEDYAEAAGRHPQVQRAAATVRWTGSWRTVFLTVDRLGGLPVDDAFKDEMRRHLERFRMAGQDVEIDGPRFVPLEVELAVCIDPEYFRADVAAALLAVCSSTTLPDGRRGLFHPDNFTFGQSVYLSRLYAAAQAVAGVRFVDVAKFRRLGSEDVQALADGVLTVGRLEIARLDNNPNFPENGVLRVIPRGGR